MQLIDAIQTSAAAFASLNAQNSILKLKALTASEMALTPHNLNQDASLATLTTGEVYMWDWRFQHWARWK